jgi:molecular chaperone DnaK
MEMNDGVFEVLATSGDTFLGGEDFDLAIMRWLFERFQTTNGVDASKDNSVQQRFKEVSEKAKCELSSLDEVEIRIPFVIQGPDGPLHLETALSRSDYEEMVAPLVNRMIAPIQDALQQANHMPSDVTQVILVGGQSRMPLVQKTLREFFGKEPDKEINPDEVVAVGAAIQGAVLSGDIHDLVLLDVTPLSLGIEAHGGEFVKIIGRNTTVPARDKRIFTTVADNQARVEIHVLQGERELAGANKSLGRFDLVNLPPLPAGVPQIEVSFDIDSNGIVKVTALDLMTNAEQVMNIQPSSGLSEFEIQRMIQDASQYAEEDSKRKDELKYIASTEGLLYSCDKAFSDFGKELSEEQRGGIKKLFALVRQAIAEKDISVIKSNEAKLLDAQGLLTSAAIAASEDMISVVDLEGDNDGDSSGTNVI